MCCIASQDCWVGAGREEARRRQIQMRPGEIWERTVDFKTPEIGVEVVQMLFLSV